jgi:ABC-type multidrug transport system permease subunit
MKLVTIVKKNFKLLLRNKSSAIVVLLGPLLIILLIGLAFNNVGSEYMLTLGVYSQSYTNSTDTFITGLSEEYDLNEFSSEQECIDSVKKGSSNACLIFPPDMVLEDEFQDDISIYLDESRVNLMDTIINRLSEIIGVSSESTSKDLTSSLLTTISLTKIELESNLFRAINIKQNTDTMISDVDTASTSMDGMDLEVGEIDLDSVDSGVSTLYSRAKSVKSDALDALGDALDIIKDEPGLGVNSTEYDTINESYVEIDGTNITQAYNSFSNKLDSAIDNVADVEEKLSTANTKKSTAINKIKSVKTNLNSVKSDIIELKSSLESISDSISSIKVLSAESIVNPVTTTIKPVTTSSNKSLYLLPYLIILVILFIGVMLSSTSIVIDKMSPAAFRTFASPTRDSFYLLSYYITNITILLVQIIIIGGLALFFLKFSVGSNIYLTLLIIFLASSLFVLIGMGFGHLFKSQEAVTIASLSFSSVLLFISNLIIPLETTPQIVQEIARYNPFVILSDMLRKVMLFNVGILEIINDLSLILLYIIVVFIIILVIQKLTKMIFFKKIPHNKSKVRELSNDQVFRLSNGNSLRTKRDLLSFLETCESAEFREFVDYKNNRLNIWLKDVLREKKLARKLRKITDRQKMSKIVEEDIAKGVTSRR